MNVPNVLYKYGHQSLYRVFRPKYIGCRSKDFRKPTKAKSPPRVVIVQRARLVAYPLSRIIKCHEQEL